MFSGIGKTFTRFISTVEDSIKGPNQLRRLSFLLEDGREEDAHKFYLEILNDPNFDVVRVNPSVPYTFVQNTENDTFLHMAARNGLLSVVRCFLEKGANPNVTNAKSETALHSLCSNPINLKGTRQEILKYIQTWRDVYFKAGLVSEDIAINHLNLDGNSPVHLAASNGLLECVRQLVEMKSNLSIVNKDQLRGKTLTYFRKR